MFWPPIHPPADHTFGELHGYSSLTELDEHDGDDDAERQGDHRRRTRTTCYCQDASRSRTGMPDTTEAKMIIDMPLPMPRWLISSPIHISSAVPATRVGMIR